MTIGPDVEESNVIDDFSLLEVRKAVLDIKIKRAIGVDEISGEVLKTDNIVSFLHKMFNKCFKTGSLPKLWNKTFIRAIPKCSISDPKDP